MSESARALCQIIERRPFLALTDLELRMLTYLMGREVARDGAGLAAEELHGRLRDEGERRAAFGRGERNAYDQADAALHDAQSEKDGQP